MKNGWIKIHRKISEKPFWRKGRFSWGQAVIDLFLQAYIQDTHIILNDIDYLIPAGSFVTSQRKLAERWKWGIARVNFFLSYLQKTERLIKYKTEHNFTHIYIVNWDKYQKRQDETEQETEHKAEQERNKSGTRAETKKEYKEDKEDINNAKAVESPKGASPQPATPEPKKEKKEITEEARRKNEMMNKMVEWYRENIKEIPEQDIKEWNRLYFARTKRAIKQILQFFNWNEYKAKVATYEIIEDLEKQGLSWSLEGAVIQRLGDWKYRRRDRG